VSWFDSIDGQLYYTTKKQDNQFELLRADPDGEDPLVWDSPIASVQVANGKLVCQLSSKEVVLLDGTGDLLVRVADPIGRVLASDDGVLLQSANRFLYLL